LVDNDLWGLAVRALSDNWAELTPEPLPELILELSIGIIGGGSCSEEIPSVIGVVLLTIGEDFWVIGMLLEIAVLGVASSDLSSKWCDVRTIGAADGDHL